MGSPSLKPALVIEISVRVFAFAMAVDVEGFCES
jgi:hypothetical protein